MRERLVRTTRQHASADSGVILLVVLMVALAIGVLAAITTGRVVAETARQEVLEDETRAFNQAFAELHRGLNIVSNSLYDEENHNLVLRAAMSATGLQAADDLTGDLLLTELGGLGGAYDSSASADSPSLFWLEDPAGVEHGVIPGTTIRVYRGRDYLQRLQKLRGDAIVPVDPFGASFKYYVLESLGRSGSTLRVVAALVRETEPFSSFVFFQNQHTLGVSGRPRGLIHANLDVAFYFPNGSYMDGVTAVDGFSFQAGATQGNTNIMNGNPNAAPITLEDVDFEDLKTKANLYLGQEGLDAEILMLRDGRIRVKPYTPPRWDLVEFDRTRSVIVDYEDRTRIETQQVQVGTTTEERTRSVVTGYETETYDVTTPIYEDEEVERTRDVPIWDERTVTRTRWIEVFVPYETDAEGGTTVAGEGTLGEYVWVAEEYETTEWYISGYTTETYTETIQVQVGETTETRSRDVPIYGEETYTVEVPVYEDQDVEITESVPIYDDVVVTEQRWQYSPPIALGYDMVWVRDASGVIFIDGRILSLHGELDGRVTIVSTDKVRIDGNIRYIDGDGDTAMLNGTNTSGSYTRNPDYDGKSVLGVIARDDILFTDDMPNSAEINGTLLSVAGRIGIDGFAITEDGQPTKDLYYGMTEEEIRLEDAYERGGTYRTRLFVKDSLRRIGGLISQERIMETYIRSRRDGTAFVDSGFKRGQMKFDINLLFNPPPNFVEIPRPALVTFAPIFLVRNHDT